jgi:micrococcal nuclease
MAIGLQRGWVGTVVLLILVAYVLLRGGPSHGQRTASDEQRVQRAFVSRVIDGDTVEVRIAGRSDDVRYIGVDTPETVKPDTPVQCFGPQASAFNHRLVERRSVRLVFDRERRDVYGRLLAYVYLPGAGSDGRALFVNAELARRGLARTLTIPPNDTHARLFARLAGRAGVRGRGLWGACPL